MCVLQPKWDTFKDLQILSLWKPMIILLCWNSFDPIPCEFIRFSDVTEANSWISNRSRKAWKKVLKQSWKSWLLQVKNMLYMLLSRSLFGHGWLFFGFLSGSSRFRTAWQSPSLRHCSCNINCWVLTILQNIIIWPKKTGDSKINRYVKDQFFLWQKCYLRVFVAVQRHQTGEAALRALHSAVPASWSWRPWLRAMQARAAFVPRSGVAKTEVFQQQRCGCMNSSPKMDGLWRDDLGVPPF